MQVKLLEGPHIYPFLWFCSLSLPLHRVFVCLPNQSRVNSVSPGPIDTAIGKGRNWEAFMGKLMTGPSLESKSGKPIGAI
jgi:hypothetical protein